jgi:hypothetical protein
VRPGASTRGGCRSCGRSPRTTARSAAVWCQVRRWMGTSATSGQR